VLFGVRGHLMTRSTSTATHFEAPLGEHSEKPERFYEIVREASYPPYGEAFQGAAGFRKLVSRNGDAMSGGAPPSSRAADNLRLEAIVETMDLAASYARSASEAPWRGERLTLGVHLKQLRLAVIVAREAFKSLDRRAA
jgi:hypothetical protein